MNCILRELGGPGVVVRRTDRTMIRTAAHIPFTTSKYMASMHMSMGKSWSMYGLQHGACLISQYMIIRMSKNYRNFNEITMPNNHPKILVNNLTKSKAFLSRKDGHNSFIKDPIVF